MIKLKSLIKENSDSEKDDLLKKYRGIYYVVSNYGWGDGSCSDGMNSYDALMLSLDQDPIDENPPQWLEHQTLTMYFENRLLPNYYSGRKPIHYISDIDCSSNFNGNPQDI